MNQLIENPKDAARRIASKAIVNGFKPEALHEYTDEHGMPLYWRIRLRHPDTRDKWIRPMQKVEEKYLLGEPKFPAGKPLYNLQHLKLRPDDPVIVCEGEWCVDSLATLGILSTTSGSADSAEKADWQPLAGRKVILWPDNDEAGQRYIHTVASILSTLDCKLQLIDVAALSLPTKGDIVDWLAANPEARAEDIFALPTINNMESPVIAKNASAIRQENNKTDDERNKNQAVMLVAFVEEHAELFHDENADVYAQDLTTGETRRLDGRQFKDWLVASFYQLTGKSPRDQSLREALGTLAGLARFRGKCHNVYVRVARHADAYFLDLGETGRSRAIQIKPGNWEVVTKPPVHFLRPETIRPLPEPVRGGNLSALWQIVNIPEGCKLLVITWLAECLRPDTPFPILELIGEQGSAKSTTQAMLRRLVDANACDLRAAPKTAEDIFIGAGMNWIVSYENISHLSAPMQDALCVLATGGGFAKRKLYSDMDEAVITVKRPVVLNGISVAITAQDLIDRALSIETPLIVARAETTDLWQTYDNQHGQLLGTLLDIVVEALARLPHIHLPSTDSPRLIEFARFGMAIAETMGKSTEDFLSQFNISRQEAIARTIDASPVASALIEWFESRGNRIVSMPIKSLFQEVEQKKPPNTDAWPRSAKGFADALRRAAPALRQIGIECRSLGKIGSYVVWEIKPRE
jgi:hypothetical protein